METLEFLFTSTFYPPFHIGGDAVHVKYLAEELAKIGHEVHVFHSLDAHRLKRKNQLQKVEHDGVHTHHIRTPFNMSAYAAYVLGNSSYVTRKFKALVEEIKPDVVHHHNISLLGYNILKKQRDYLNLYTAHDYWLICQQNNLLKNGSEVCESASCFLCSLICGRPPQLWRYGEEFEEAIEEVDLLIAPSNYIKNKVSQKIHAKVVTIPNFVPKPPNNLEPSGFSDFFLYAGVLEKHKGILSLVNLLKKREVDVKLLIAGNGSLRHKIEESIKRHNLESKVVLLGWVDHDFLYRLLHDANALIVPSICLENSPLISLEALSVGTPVVASNNGGLPEIVGKMDQKLIFDDWSKLGDLLQGFSRKEFSSQMIRHIYEQNFSPKAYIGKYVGIIRERLGN
jgi:glycosyltransferase involved in cell wall biosynthesis